MIGKWMKLAVLIPALAAGVARAQSGTVSGVVKDINGGGALPGVTISDGSQSVTTGSDGSYQLTESAGKKTLTASTTGYLTTSQVTTVSSGVTNVVNWALTHSYGTQVIPATRMNYTVLAWNDLGMHCDQDDYSYFMVLPPYNTLHVEAINRHGGFLSGSGYTVSYSFPKKTNSTLHTNFWSYASQYGFNVAPNVGIKGYGLSGNMAADPNGHGWIAEGIPVTPYDDDGTWDPFGAATVTLSQNGSTLQTATVVAPVSTEMMCVNCHSASNPQLDILQKHDSHNGTTLASDQSKGIVHACSQCHSDNVLGAPGQPGVESLSLAMHNFHKDKMNATATATNTTPDCYNCHPGPKTQCLRGIMSRAGKSCHDCHGDMYGMTSSLQGGRQAWLQEPRCDSCHDAKHAENAGTLYRNSVFQNSPDGDMNNRLYCEACHNGTHGEFITSVAADPSIPQKFQGDSYWIWNCTVCHQFGSGTMHR